MNFQNPYRPTASNPGYEAIKTAFQLDGSSLLCVRLPELIALKLYADSRNDDRDVAELLDKNRDHLDIGEVQRICGRYGLSDRLALLLEQAGIQGA